MLKCFRDDDRYVCLDQLFCETSLYEFVFVCEHITKI